MEGGEIMQFNDIVTAISTVGFPIVACGALFYMINTTMKELTSAIGKLEKAILKVVKIDEGEDE